MQETLNSAHPTAESAEVQDVDVFDVARALMAHWRFIGATSLLAGVLMYGATWLIKPTFTASTMILAPQQSQNAASALLGSLGGVAGLPGGALPGIKNPADQWVGLMRSRTVADVLLQQFKLAQVYDTEFNSTARGQLADNTRIATGKDGLISIDVDDESPQRAAALANAYVDQLQLLSKRLAITEAAQRRLFLEHQLKDVNASLVKAEIALRKGGLNSSILKTTPSTAVAEMAQIKAQVAAQEIRISAMGAFLTRESPERQQAESVLLALKNQLKAYEKSTPDSDLSDDYIRNYRELKYQEMLFELLSKQYEMARSDEAKEGAVIQVVDKAVTPEIKSHPKRGKLALSAVVVVFIFSLIGVVLRLRWMSRKSLN